MKQWILCLNIEKACVRQLQTMFFSAESSYMKQTYNIYRQNLQISNELSNFKTGDIQQYSETNIMDSNNIISL